MGNSSHQLTDIVRGNVVDSGDVDLSLVSIIVAGAGLGMVWVGCLKLLSVGIDVVHGVVLPSTIASVGGGVAIDDFLFGEGEKLSRLNKVVSLNSSGCRESPA